jgi:hypothetical protein
MSFTPDPQYTISALLDENGKLRERVIYLSASLMQVQAEANAQITELRAQLSSGEEKSDG